MSPEIATRFFILGYAVLGLVIPLVWTLVMQIKNPKATISQQVFDLCTKSGPKGLMIPVLWGAIWGIATGHLFFSGSYAP